MQYVLYNELLGEDSLTWKKNKYRTGTRDMCCRNNWESSLDNQEVGDGFSDDTIGI